MMNVLNGGVHADNPVDFQEFMIAPVGAASFAASAADGRRDLPRSCKSHAEARGLATAVGDEGGFAPALESNEAPLELLMAAIEAAGYRAGRRQSRSALDPASSEFFDDGGYELAGEGRTSHLDRDGRLLGEASPAATRSSRSRTAWPRMTGTAGAR